MKKDKLTKGILKTTGGGICFGITAMIIPTFILSFLGIAGGGIAGKVIDKQEEYKDALAAEARPAIVRYWEDEIESGNMTQKDLLQETLELREGDAEYVYNYVKENEELSEEFSGSLKKIEDNQLKLQTPNAIREASTAAFFASMLLWMPTYFHIKANDTLPGKKTLESGIYDIKEATMDK